MKIDKLFLVVLSSVFVLQGGACLAGFPGEDQVWNTKDTQDKPGYWTCVRQIVENDESVQEPRRKKALALTEKMGRQEQYEQVSRTFKIKLHNLETDLSNVHQERVAQTQSRKDEALAAIDPDLKDLLMYEEGLASETKGWVESIREVKATLARDKYGSAWDRMNDEDRLGRLEGKLRYIQGQYFRDTPIERLRATVAAKPQLNEIRARYQEVNRAFLREIVTATAREAEILHQISQLRTEYERESKSLTQNLSQAQKNADEAVTQYFDVYEPARARARQLVLTDMLGAQQPQQQAADGGAQAQ